MQEYEEDSAFIVSLADYFKENKDAVHYGKYAVLGYDHIFMGHKTVLNWSNALVVMLNGFQMIDEAASGQPPFLVRLWQSSRRWGRSLYSFI